MRKRVAFRALIILVASALLLTSTGAYNILVFADQNMESFSLSATDEGETSAPSVSTYGSELLPESDELASLELAAQAVIEWVGLGTSQSPYEIGDIAHLLDAYNIVNNPSNSDKYFVLTNDIDLSGLSIGDFHRSIGGSAAYLLSAEGSNPSSVYFDLDGAGYTLRFNSNAMIDASGYRYFALFGFMNEYCAVRDLTIEDLNVNLSNAAAGSLVAFKNSGTIEDVTVKACSMAVSGSTANTDWNLSGQQYSRLDNNINTDYDVYPGFAAVAADNRGVVSDITIEDFRISVSNASHYVGGVVGQNRGTSLSDCSVNGLSIIATASNAYIGGVCAYNVAGSTVSNHTIDLLGHYYDSVLGVTKTYGGLLYGGRYVGGLVGRNDGTLTNSLIQGSFSTVSTPNAEAYDMCGIVNSDNDPDAVPYYYGGAAAGGDGTISQVTVQNLGFYMSLGATDQPCAFGGVIAAASAQGSVSGCVSTGSFVSSAYSSVCYAGGVIGYAPVASTLSNCTTLFRLQNKGHYLTGAVIGFGGSASMASSCYWSSEISGCVTAYALPYTQANSAGYIENDDSAVAAISDRSLDLNSSSRAIVSTRNTLLTGLAKPTHGWSDAQGNAIGATLGVVNDDPIPNHTVTGVVNSLDAVGAPYQQTMTLPSGVGYSGRPSFPVDFKLDVFIVASAAGVGDPDDPSDPLQISSSGMTRFLYCAPYANYVLTQDVTIDETEWEPVAFCGQLSGGDENHVIYAPCRVFSAVVGSRSEGVAVDTTNYTTSLDYSKVEGGYIRDLGVTLTPDYFVLASGAYNQSVFGSLFGATLRSVSLTNDTSEPVRLCGSRQGAFADAAYNSTYVYGCSMSGFTYVPNDNPSLVVDSSVKCGGSGTDMGAFIGYLDASANVVDNCVIDADVTLEGSSAPTHAAAFIGNISVNAGYVFNSIVVTTVSSGVAAVFGAAPSGETNRFHNIFWARNSHTDTSVPISDDRESFAGLELWGVPAEQDQTDAQLYACYHTLNSGVATVELSLPEHMDQIQITSLNQAKSEFIVTRISDGADTYGLPEMKLANNHLVLSFTPTPGNHTDGESDLFKITHQKTGLCAYIEVIAQMAGALVCHTNNDDPSDPYIGYYEIKSAADLKNLSDTIALGESNEAIVAASRAYVLMADIDMSYFDGSEGREFFPIGCAGNERNIPFAGAFIGAVKNAQTGERYTISNVTVIAENNGRDHLNNGLFGVVDATSSTTTYDGNGSSLTKACEIGGFNLDHITVVGGDCVGALAGSVQRNSSVSAMYNYPIHDISVTNATVTGGNESSDALGRRVGGLIGEVQSNSAALSGIELEHVDVKTYFYNSAFINRVATISPEVNGYFTTGYFQDHMGIGGVIGSVYSDINRTGTYDNTMTLTVTDTHVSSICVAGMEDWEENEAYATMDAGGVIGSALNYYGVQGVDPCTILVIGDPNTTQDVTVVDSRIMAYGNTGGVIGASSVESVLSNCVVRGSNAAAAPERSAMQVLSRTLYYMGGIAGYIGVSTNMAGASSVKLSSEVYASINNCSVVNAYVASTETSYKVRDLSASTDVAPMRNVSVGGIIGGGNGQGYTGDTNTYSSGDEEAEDLGLAPFVSGCTVNHSRIEGIVTGGIVGADAEIQFIEDYDSSTSDHMKDPSDTSCFIDPSLLDFRDYITHCSVTNSTVTTVSNAVRIAGDSPNTTPITGTDHFVLASGVGGIMGANVRFHREYADDAAVISYGYIHDTVIEYCTVDGSTTVENDLPFVEATTNCTASVGGVIGMAFTNCAVNSYEQFGRCVLRYNEVDAAVTNAACLSLINDFNADDDDEMNIKAGAGGFIGAVKGGANQNDGQIAAVCFVPGIHVYTSVFSGVVSGLSAIGGAIGIVNFASDTDFYNSDPCNWELEEGAVPNQMLYNLALAGTVSLSGSAETYSLNSNVCYGGYVVGHISAGDGMAFAFNNDSVYNTDPDYIVGDVTYTSLGGDNRHLVAFGFLNGDVTDGDPPRVDFSGCYNDVNVDEYGDPLFNDMVSPQYNHYNQTHSIRISENDDPAPSFVIKAANTAAYNWSSSDSSVAEAITTTSSSSKTVKVHGLMAGTTLISIPFVGTLTDGSSSGDWESKEVFIPCGFKYETVILTPLTTAENQVTHEVYHLIQTPYDMSKVGYSFTEPDPTLSSTFFKNGSLSAEAMGRRYALYNETGVIEFTDEMYAGDGSYPGGLTPVGKTNYPFTGSFETLPEGTYTFSTKTLVYNDQQGGIPSFSSSSGTTVVVSYDPDNANYVGYERMTLRNVKVKAEGSVGASLFGYVSGAIFRNFDIDGMTLTGTTNGNYVGSVASKVFPSDATRVYGANPAGPYTDDNGTAENTNDDIHYFYASAVPITLNSINLNNFDFSDADYIGGLVGGIFANSNPAASSSQQEALSPNTTPAVISHCTVGNPDAEAVNSDFYTNSMNAYLGVGGLLAHSSQNATNITACTVRDVDIRQEVMDGLQPDYTNLDNGAAGIAMAYAGNMVGDDPTTANVEERIVVEHCAITGEVVGGAVMRSYTSSTATNFSSAGTYGAYPGDRVTCTAAASVALTGIDIVDSVLTGTVDVDKTLIIDNVPINAAPYSASGGILARVDANTSAHTVSDCTVDATTTITAVDGVGGIVGCLESLDDSYGIGARSIIYHAEFGVTVTDCVMNASLKIQPMQDVSSELSFNRGVGGVIGVFYTYSPLIFTKISNCTVGGVIRATETAGGVIGSILADSLTGTGFTNHNVPSFLDLSNMDEDDHLVSNCLVTTRFVTTRTVNNVTFDVSPFTERSFGIGVILGYYYTDNLSNAVFVPSTSGYYSTNNNYPFYHVMFSSANYSEDYVALFGFDNDQGDKQCLNGVENATAYCYNLDRASSDPEQESSHFSVWADGSDNAGALNAGANEAGDLLINRINATKPNSAGKLELSSTSFNSTNANTLTFAWGANVQDDEKELVFSKNGADPSADPNEVIQEGYLFNSSALPNAFTTTSDSAPSNANAGEKVFSFTLASVELANGTDSFDLAYDAATNPQKFTLTLKDNVALEATDLIVVFTYTNGLKMSLNIFINVHAREYWRLDSEVSELPYTCFLVFNAADLAALQQELSADATFGVDSEGDEYNHVSRANALILQCYDVFWTVSDPDVLDAANAALFDEDGDPLTIADVLGEELDVGAPMGNGEYFALGDWLGYFVRPNPAYDPNETEDPQPKEIAFYDYFSEKYDEIDEEEDLEDYDLNDFMDIPMADLVGDIGESEIDYGVYGDTSRATIIDPYDFSTSQTVPFTGRYVALANSSTERYNTETENPLSTGVTESGECYALYGLDLRGENVVANSGTDAPYAGLIGRLGEDALIENVRFINPKISVINSYGALQGNSTYYAGVLAGSVSGDAAISNLSITGEGDGSSYVKAIARMNCASVWAGGVVGQINGGTTVTDVSVTGIDVVSSYTANARDNEASAILAGGLAGKAIDAPVFSNVDVTDCRVLGGHIANPVGNIKSCGGGMFGAMNASVTLNGALKSEVIRTVVGGSYITSSYGYDRTNQNNTAMDIAGGVAALSTGVSTVTSVNVLGSQIIGGDVSGGIVGQLDNNSATSLTIKTSSVGYVEESSLTPQSGETVADLVEANKTNVLVVGTSGVSNRFNTAGGAVGNVQNLNSLYIGQITGANAKVPGVDFNGVVGAYGYDNHNREATAGGMIGSISGAENINLSTYLDKIQICGCTVQGEVNGFNRETVTDMQCAGSAGGIVGKIACAARKSDLGNTKYFISDCIMSAKMNLYTSVYGVTVDCADNQRNRNRNTNVGKLIGRMANGALIDADCAPIIVAEDVWLAIKNYPSSTYRYSLNGTTYTTYDEGTAFDYALRGKLLLPGSSSEYLIAKNCNITDSIRYVYGSSYPQDIVLYGNSNLCGIDFELYADRNGFMPGVAVPYVDCNVVDRYVADRETEVEGQTITVVDQDQRDLPAQLQSFMVSESDAPNGNPESNSGVYAAKQYTENAFVAVADENDPNASNVHYKYFRFYNPDDKLIFKPEVINVLDANGEPVAGASASAQYSAGTTYEDSVVMYDLSDEENPAEVETIGAYNYNVGVMTITLPPEQEMIGSLVLNFAYGIQMNSSLTCIEIEGDGTVNSPYLIKQPKHFIVMRALHSNNSYFKQMNNIDLNDPSQNDLNRYTSLDGFEPIGTTASPFVGHFDGNGYIIQNLYINDEAVSATGLFGCVGKGTDLRNIHVEVADALIIRDLEDERTLVNGGIVGGNNTGGLVGVIKATGSQTTVTNCSVAGSHVVGGMNVGGLVGSSAGTVTFNNCFTSTTTASYAGTANVGALLGAVSSGACSLTGCYTAGYAVVGSATSDAAVGGLVGRNGDTCDLTLTNCFVGATASGSTGSTVGLAVAANANSGTITASGNTVAALTPPDAKGKTIRIIAPGVSGSGNYYESRMLGVIDDGTAAIAYTGANTYEKRVDYTDAIPAYNVDVYDGSAADTSRPDAYSAAYRQLIAAAVKVDQSTKANDNNVQTESILTRGGLLYPLTMTFSTDTDFTTSVYDLSDTVPYPMGVDQELTGNGSDKNTDLLFKTMSETTTDANDVSTTVFTTTIYRNIFRDNDASVAVLFDGETYANGEIFYDYNLPYAAASQTITVGGRAVNGEIVGGNEISIARKIMYPVVDIDNYGEGQDQYIFPIATARQLKAMTSDSEAAAGTKFGFLRRPSAVTNKLDYQIRNLLLVADLDLGSTVFTPFDTFTMSFYGNGRVISNMQINPSSGNAAMFTSVQSGSIYDLGLMGVNVTTSGGNAAMLIASLNQGLVSNCFAIGSVTSSATTAGTAGTVGGLVAYAVGNGSNEKSVIENCLVSGNVTGFIGQDNGGVNPSAAGLLGRAGDWVAIDNVTVTANVNANNTYAICGPASGTHVTVLNAVYGGQMTNAFNLQNVAVGVAANQHLIPDNIAAAELYADSNLGLLIEGNEMLPTSALVAITAADASHFTAGSITNFGSGSYYPAPAAVSSVDWPAFQAGVRFAAAAIRLSYVGSTDSVSSVAVPAVLGDYGTATLSADSKLGAYVNVSSEGDLLTINPESMRLTKKVSDGVYTAADEVSGITGAVEYSMISPVSNNYLVRTVNNVTVQKTFTLCYKFVDAATGQPLSATGDKAIIEVQNDLADGRKSTTGLAIAPAGDICENMMLKADTNGNYILWSYAQTGSGKKVNSVTVRPAYNNGSSIVSNNDITITTYQADPAKCSFSGTDSAIGADEDNNIRYSYLLVTVAVDPTAWGLQRAAGNWIYD